MHSPVSTAIICVVDFVINKGGIECVVLSECPVVSGVIWLVLL